MTTITPSIDAYLILELENSIGDWKNLEPMVQSERAFLLFSFYDEKLQHININVSYS